METVPSDRTFPEEMRVQMRNESQYDLAQLLSGQACLIEAAVRTFAKSPTRENKTHLNAMWALGERYMMQSEESAAA
jgi:hypothetical protein